MPNADARRELLRIPLLGTSVNRPLEPVCLSPLGGIMLTVSTHRKNVGWPGEEDDAVSSAEENKAIVRRLFKALAEGDLDVIRELLAPDFVDHHPYPGEEDPGPEGYLRAAAGAHAAFTDLSYVFVEQMPAEGDRVVSRLTMRATHDRAEIAGFAPTSKEYRNTFIAIHRIEGGKIAEEWAEGSDIAQLTQARLEQEIGERERVEQELRVARRIQQASLPKEVPQLEGWQISPYYQPAREVGGDFYDFHLLSEGRLGVVVGDATGKGVPAALVMSTTCSMLQAVSEALDSISPGEVLSRVNETLVDRIPQNMFVTCFYGVLDPKSATFTYANAGHDLPYLWHGGAEELRARGMPLGLMPEMSYEQKEIVLEPTDSALLYSDGLVEAHDPQGEMFGFPRLRALIAEYAEERSLGEALLEELYSFVGEGWEQEDDITLLTLRRS
jgi:serine phosphatase RsbU (regulator of sigma subunit)/ketosteroid isomerase-like protein